jgi:hypothetical protein
LKYKKIAENIIATVGTIHKGIKKNIRDDQTKKTNIWNKSERAYYRALLAMNGTSNNKNASLLFGRAIKLLLLSERQTFWAHVLSCINNCLQIHGQDEKKIEELKQLFNNIQGSLQLLPASLCNYIVYILTSSFHVINDDKTIQFFISALHTILDRKPFYPDERELIQMLVVRLYNHNKQYTDALAYLKNILNEHEWTDGNKFTVELIKFDLLENLEG